MSIIFAPVSLVVMHCVRAPCRFASDCLLTSYSQFVVYEILERDSIRDNISNSAYFVGVIFGSAWWIAYAWFTRLRYDFPNSPAVHTAFLFSFSLFMVALFCMVLVDPGPGACGTPAKEALKTITEDLIWHGRLTTEAFCVRCLSVKRQYTRHCSTCKKCITHHGITAQYEHHKAWILNCIGAKNHIYFLAFMVSLIAGIVIFDYLVWTYSTVRMNGPLPAPSCVPDYAVCELMSADMFLISIAIWSSLGLLWGMWIMIRYVGAVWKALWHSLGM
ncbi:hypothetical protein BC826DRAFT_1061541 [Russula brevipes]|nr:hypothetical protein BC826DRAFT_1061541 [Russula brevipes]